MKKVYLFVCALAVAYTGSAQTITNPGMESWRASSSGSTTPVTIHAPVSWFGFDSLIINAEETLVPAFLYPGYTPTDLHAQLFEETSSAHVHGGNASAKLVSVKQDTLGVFAGSLSNAQPSLNITSLIGGGGSIQNAITYTGGTATTKRVVSVSAWVQYFPGKDSVTQLFGGNDSATLLVQAIGNNAGADTVVGTGTVTIGPKSTFTQITANVVYTDNVDLVNNVRIIFSSSRLQGGLDSSIMYVDDVTMVSAPQAVNSLVLQGNSINVYPNPASGLIHFDGAQKGQVCNLTAVNGQLAATEIFNGSNTVDVSYLPAGMYFYNITDASGNKVQNGKVTVSK